MMKEKYRVRRFPCKLRRRLVCTCILPKRYILQHKNVTVFGNKKELNIRILGKRSLGCRSLKQDKTEGKADDAI